MKPNTIFFLRLFLLGGILPIIMSNIVYVGFATNYTGGVFSKQGFEHQYEAGIYKYRVLGNTMLLKTYDLVKSYDLPAFAPYSLRILDNAGDPQFYSAYFYMNTVFLCLTCALLIIILGAHRKNTDFMMVDLPALFMCFLMAITQYVVVPYDTLSYFFLVTAVILIIYDSKMPWNLIALCIVVILATLTRETAVLILGFYFAIHHRQIITRPTTLKINQQQGVLLSLSACFVFTYLGLRWIFGSEHAVYEVFLLTKNPHLGYAILGVLFYASLALLLFITTAVTKEISVFFLVTFPYVLFIVLFADPWEIRLWTPLILLLIILKVRAYQPSTAQTPS
ncbi:MAG TPA: hypothetical protein VJ821_05895 [Anaerolineales bacterium]|nr:hypothetical protein [Anaerolineales bacterium]